MQKSSFIKHTKINIKWHWRLMRATEEGENKIVKITFLNSKILIRDNFTKLKKDN